MARAERRKPRNVASKPERTRALSPRGHPPDAVEALGEELARLDGALDQAIRGPHAARAARGLRPTDRARNPLPVLRLFLDWLDELRGSERANDLGLGRRFEEAVAPFFASLDRYGWRVGARGGGNMPADGPAPSGARTRRRAPGSGRT